MHTWRLLGPAAGGLILFGCVSAHESGDQSGVPHIGFTQVKAAPDSYRGQSATFGGQVLAARRLKEGTRIEILQLPLTPSGQPISNLTKSEGRFVALQREFLDPATIPAGTFVTVSGSLAGSVDLPLDETEYTYPMMEIKDLQVWDPREDTRGRPYMGPAPYGGPFWSPYRRSWPYW
jgi:outer membrane lipoprotein